MKIAASRRRPTSRPADSSVLLSFSMSVGLRRAGDLGDRCFQVLALLAGIGAESDELRQVRFRLVDLAQLDEHLALVLERALVVGVEVERLGVEGRGLLEVAR